jgi:hypothetical protein
MAKSPTVNNDNAPVAAAAGPAPVNPLGASAPVSDGEIARRAYDIFLARGCEHGRDLEDWLQAERELNAPERSVFA